MEIKCFEFYPKLMIMQSCNPPSIIFIIDCYVANNILIFMRIVPLQNNMDTFSSEFNRTVMILTIALSL